MNAVAERRGARRLLPPQTPWADAAILRPGQDVVVVNISRTGALLESAYRMSPGARAELQLLGVPRRLVRGRIARCQVSRLDPVMYLGAVAFDEPLELVADRGVSHRA